MRLPDPIANTTTEAYLAYKAGVLEVGDLKPSLYDPYLHFDAWLAYWCGLTNTYPSKGVNDKNIFTGDFSQFDSQGGTGNTYAYFELPDDEEYIITLISRKAVSGNANTYFGFTKAGGNQTNPRKWAWTASSSATGPGEKFTITNVASGENLKYVSLYANHKATLDWFKENFYIQIEKGITSTDYEPHFIPEMLTDEEALVAYLSGVTNTYPEEIKDPYDVRIVGYLKYLVSVKYGRPDYPVNNEEFYLSLLMPPSVSNDTPASSITLQGTAKYPFLDLLMYGDCAQQTYSGKNLFNNNATTVFKTRTNVTALDTGVRATVTENTSGVAMAGFILGKASDYVGQTLTLSSDLANTAGTLPRVYLGLSNSAGADRVVKASLTSSGQASWTVAEDVDRPYLLLVVYSASVAEGASAGEYCDYTNLQVEASASATSYEPYVGGIPAPNPDYPQEVHMVTGKQTVKATGKNLIGGENWREVSVSGGYPTPSTGYSSITSQSPNAVSFSVPTAYGGAESGLIKISSGTTVTLSFSEVSGSVNRLFITQYDETKTRVSTLNDRSVIATTTVTATQDGYIGVAFASTVSGDFSVGNIQLEMGSTATSFEPYESKSTVVPLTCKNMFNKDATPTDTTAQTAVVPTDRGVRVEYSGAETTIARFVTYVLGDVSAYVGNTITVSSKMYVSGGNKARVSLGICKSDGSDRVTKAMLNQDGEISYTLTEADLANRPYAYLYLYANVSNEGTLAKDDYAEYTDLQVEIGSAATDYVPYRPPIELCKIGDYQDYIYKDQDGDWYLHKETGKVILTGADIEKWQYNSINSVFLIADYIMYKPDGTAPYSNYFLGKSNISSYSLLNDNETALLKSNADNRLIVKFLDAGSNITNLRSWLSSHNTMVCYPLATPTDTLITYPDVVDALNEILAGGSYKDTTYIEVTADDDNLPGLLTVTAGKE